jgi:hypothetical protein
MNGSELNIGLIKGLVSAGLGITLIPKITD